MKISTQVPDEYDAHVDPNMFGSNFMFNYHLIEDIPARSANFEDGAELLGVHGLRYPGGGVSESYFDVTAPDKRPVGFKDGFSFVGLSDFLTWCADGNQPVTIVVPTSPVLQDGLFGDRGVDGSAIDDVKDFVRALLSGDGAHGADIESFELGNEYWALMSATEYGRVSNAMLEAISEVYEELGIGEDDRPGLLVQMGSPWGDEYGSSGFYGALEWGDEARLLGFAEDDFGSNGHLKWGAKVWRCNMDIIDQIEDKDLVSGLVEHFYYSAENDEFTNESHEFDYINYDIKFWRGAGFEQPIYITEWNVEQSNSSQLGLKGAGVIVEMFADMVTAGVTSADVWLQQSSNITALAGGYSGEPELTPAGAVFKYLSEYAVNADLFNTDVSGDVEVDGYKSEEGLTYFLSSRSNRRMSIKWLEPGISQKITMVGVSKIGVDMSTSDGKHEIDGRDYSVDYYNEYDVRAKISSIDPVRIGETLEFRLKPYEVVVITYVFGDGSDAGSKGEDSSSSDIVGTSASEKLVGSSLADGIHGLEGDDVLIGAGGDDVIYGGQGDDVLNGGDGSDILNGGAGDDVLKPGLGDDIINGGFGRDFISYENMNGGVHLDVDGDSVDISNGPTRYSQVYSEIEGIRGTKYDDNISLDSHIGRVFSGKGDDKIYVNGDDDVSVRSGAGDDKVVVEGDGDSKIFGQGGNDYLSGGDGDDVLNGGRGDDFINAGGGVNVVRGGGGKDVFYFDTQADWVKVVIEDYEAGKDLIDLSNVPDQAVETMDAEIVDEGLSLSLDIDGDGEPDLEIHIDDVDDLDDVDFK